MKAAALISWIGLGKKPIGKVLPRKMPKDFSFDKFLDAIDDHFRLSLCLGSVNKKNLAQQLGFASVFCFTIKTKAWQIYRKIQMNKRVFLFEVNWVLEAKGLKIVQVTPGIYRLQPVSARLIIGP